MTARVLTHILVDIEALEESGGQRDSVTNRRDGDWWGIPPRPQFVIAWLSSTQLGGVGHTDS